MHELVGEEDGPTIGISAVDPRQREHRLAGHPRPVPAAARTMPLKGRILLLPVANRPGLRGQPALHAARRAQPQPRISRQPARQLHPAARHGAHRRIPQQDRRASSTCIPAPTGRRSTTSTSGTTRRLSRAFGSKLLYRPVDGKEGTVYAGTTKIGHPRRARHPGRGDRARRRHRRPDALCEAHRRRPAEHAAACSAPIAGRA